MFLCLVPFYLIGRIGDTRSKLESRLLQSNGIVLRDDDVLELRQTGMPYLEYEEYFPKPYEVRLYFKSSDGRRPKPDELGSSKLNQVFDRRPPPKKPLNSQKTQEKRLDGWELHVLYVEGISALELYKKTDGITEHELNHLLGLQSGNSFWVKRSAQDLPEGKVTALGFDLAREDDYIRSKRLSQNAIMFFRTKTDEFFFMSRQKEQTELAPESVKGF